MSYNLNPTDKVIQAAKDVYNAADGMNWNKYNFIPGDRVELDKNHPNHSEVIIVSMTKTGMFSRVYPANLTDPKDSDCWDTMTNRLTPLTLTK